MVLGLHQYPCHEVLCDRVARATDLQSLVLPLYSVKKLFFGGRDNTLYLNTAD